MRHWLSFGVLLLFVVNNLLGSGMPQIFGSAEVLAQEVEFKPRWDTVAKPKRSKRSEAPQETPSANETSVMYSFDRYSRQLREVCNLLERDHRRERVGRVAFDEVRVGVSCKSCKAFLKEVIEQCPYRKQVAPRPTATAAPSAEILATPGVDAVAGASATSTPAPIPSRYPLTELLDRTSALSSELYERDAGEGAVFESVKFFVDVLMKQKDLTPGERDYYGVFTAYLLSAWEGRPNSPLESGEPSKQDVQSLFE